MAVFVGILTLGLGVRLAQGRAAVAMNDGRHGRRDGGRARARRPRCARLAVRSRAGRGPVTARDRALVEPIVVPNRIWQAASPTAYGGGQPPTITHLRELEQGDKSDNARWTGRLEIVPTYADYVLDLIRSQQPLAAPLGAVVLRDRHDVGRHEPQRHGPLQHVPVLRQPPPGRRPHRRRHTDDEDGRPPGAALGGDAGAEVVRGHGRLHLLGRALQALVQRGPGDRPDHAGGRLRAGLPAAAGGAHLRDDEAPAAHPRAPRAVGEARRGPDGPGRRSRRTATDTALRRRLQSRLEAPSAGARGRAPRHDRDPHRGRRR